ncbi:MAG: hypothetical protein QGH45_14830, partial [Myxococcota bacterium]|nr:hypothetical protein [Myxococcota bacterium]
DRHTARAALSALLLLVLLAPAPALAKKKVEEAPPAEEALPAAADLFARNVEAMGGEAAIRAPRNQYARGTISIPLQGLTMTLELWAEAPDRMFTSMEMPGLGVFQSGYDGAVGWGADPMSGASLQDAAELIQSRRDADFYGDVNYATKYERMETVGRVQWGAYKAYKVHVVTPEGQEETQYFDQDTGLKVGSERMTETEMGPMPVRVTCDQHKVFSGITVASRCTEATGPIEGVIVFESFQFDSADFAFPPLPEAVQALVDEQNAASAEPPPASDEPPPPTDQPE